MQATWSENRPPTPLSAPSAPEADLRELVGLDKETVPVRLDAQDRLLPERDAPAAVWLVQDGLLGLTYGDAEGRDATVLMLGPGDFFDLLNDEDGPEYGQSAVALRPALLYRIDRTRLERLAGQYPHLARRLARSSWRRIARLQRRLAEIMTQPVRQRLAALLVDTAAAYGEDGHNGGRSLGLTLTHDDLARLVGSSREMVSKVMGQFRSNGWVRSARRTVELLDCAALAHVARPTSRDQTRNPPDPTVY